KIPHYNEISKAIRKKSLKEIQEIVKSSRDVSFLVFEHKKPMGAVSREYYLKHIPINIIDNLNLPTDTNKNIVISLDVHNDFRIKGIKDSIFFVESLVKKMSQKINKSEYKGVHRLDGFVRSNFPHKNITVNIKGRKCQKNDSNAVVLADLVLGYHRCYKPFGTKISYIKI
ncbi:MAG: hypothetical protein KAS32_30505, partial [Candidatus Peribacteraceae bacterium]|nr:hypothetical protein [Candidatus Peribacteraceae bacterium]